MPKRVDHDARRRELAEAVWRVIRRKGLEGVSVRSVAREAGMSVGSLRYYFSTQSELLAFSMRLVSDRVRARLEGLELTGNVRADVEAAIAETLPLDEERLSEAVVWLAFLGKTLVDPALNQLALESHEALYRLFRMLIEALVRHGLSRPGIDVELEVRRLHALVDGLVIHGVTSPHSVTPEMIRQTIAYHLNRLQGSPR